MSESEIVVVIRDGQCVDIRNLPKGHKYRVHNYDEIDDRVLNEFVINENGELIYEWDESSLQEYQLKRMMG
tara:strand:+ start:403 stop:615 length:213 start_codon:yes stop_codon:yes gene_type:complete